MKNLKSSSNRKYLVWTLKAGQNRFAQTAPQTIKNTTHSVPKSLWKDLKFLYVITTNVPNNFCEGSILKIVLKKFIKIRTDLKVGWTVNRAVLWWSENRLPNGPKQLPKILNLKYVILKDVGNKFYVEHFLRFNPQWSPKKNNKMQRYSNNQNPSH